MAETVQKTHKLEIHINRDSITILRVSEDAFQNSLLKVCKEIEEVKSRYNNVAYAVKVVKK